MFQWSSAFDKQLEKATSTQLLEPDWNVILEICDTVRSGDVDPRYALNAVKKKLISKNPNVTLLALHTLESMVKNCGHPIHKEIATKDFIEDFKELLRLHAGEPIKEKVLELIQAWAHAFRKEPAYRIVQDMMTYMRTTEGIKFPQLKESDAMFAAQVPPEWEDSDNCHLCRVGFTTFNRKVQFFKALKSVTTKDLAGLFRLEAKHHCRKCGQVFCGKCSTQTCALPKLGIEKKVRVCDTCFLEVNPGAELLGAGGSNHSSPGAIRPIQTRSPNLQGAQGQTQQAKEQQMKEQQLKEEEELQLAIALSQSEADFERHRKDKPNVMPSYAPPTSVGPQVGWGTYPTEMVEANAPTRSECGSTTGSTESELTHYLDRKYWDERSNMRETETPKPGKGVGVEGQLHEVPNGDGGSIEQFEEALQKTLDVFVNRLRSNEMRGRPIANDTTVQSLFVQISSLHARLLQCVQETDDQRVYYEGMQDRLQQIRDARAALDALREEHREEERKRIEEAERSRQMQMAAKLEIMRKRKHEYLQYQHHLAMMKMQEQEMQYRSMGVQPPMVMPNMVMPPQGAPGQPVYAPQPQYPIGVAPMMHAMPGALPQQGQPPQGIPQSNYPQQQPMSPPHNHPNVMPPGLQQGMPQGVPPGVAPPMNGVPSHYYQPSQAPQQAEYAPQQAEYAPQQVEYAPQQVEYAPQQVEYAPQQVEYAPQQVAHPSQQVAHPSQQMTHPPQQVAHQPGSGQPAFEPYNMQNMVNNLPAPPQTPLPQPCAPPQTPTPTPNQELHLPNVPTHQPQAPPHQHEAQLISFD